MELAPGDVRLATLADISEGGAFIERVSASIGQRVVVHLRVGDADWSAPLRAIVRWTSTQGVGVEFQPIDPRSTSAVGVALMRARRPSHARQRTVARSSKQG